MSLAQTHTKPFLTFKEFKQAAGGVIGTNNLYALLQAGRIKHLRLGKKYLIPSSEVQDFPRRVAESTIELT